MHRAYGITEEKMQLTASLHGTVRGWALHMTCT
jgi:hypothetical protein